MNVLLRLGLGLAIAAAPAAAHAAQDQDTFEVTATVVASCEVTAEDLDFGDYDPVSATPLDASTTLEVFCTNGTDYDIGLDAGEGAGATIAARRMTRAGGATLQYALYQDQTRTALWGPTEDVDAVAGTGTGEPQEFTIYGRAPINQTAPAGAYDDTITVTVSY